MASYKCSECGLAVIVTPAPDYKVIRPCKHEGAVIADLSATTQGMGGVKTISPTLEPSINTAIVKNKPTEIKQVSLKSELEEILKQNSKWCMCGHGESCSSCNPHSEEAKTNKRLQELINKLDIK